jgi:hypothetical protein
MPLAKPPGQIDPHRTEEEEVRGPVLRFDDLPGIELHRR